MESKKIEMSKNTPTKISDLQKYSNGAVVELPPFAEGMPIFARLRRPSMMALMADGKIPNSLLSAAESMFLNGVTDTEVSAKDMYSVMECMCRACMIEPTYQDIIDAGLQMTDEQMIFVFNYSQIGINALRSFRNN